MMKNYQTREIVSTEPLNHSERFSLLQRVLPRRPPPGEPQPQPQPPQRAPTELGPQPGRSRFGEVCRGAVQHRMQPRVDQQPRAVVPQPQLELGPEMEQQPPAVRPQAQSELGAELRWECGGVGRDGGGAVLVARPGVHSAPRGNAEQQRAEMLRA
jgi:hypothetical protein